MLADVSPILRQDMISHAKAYTATTNCVFLELFSSLNIAFTDCLWLNNKMPVIWHLELSLRAVTAGSVNQVP